jgi:hypothetical protein
VNDRYSRGGGGGGGNYYGGGGGGQGGGGRGREVSERDFFKESNTTKPATLNCPYCRTVESYELRWLVRKKIDRLPNHADERARAIFAKTLSYMVLLDDHASCKKCRKRFEISGVKTTAFI